MKLISSRSWRTPLPVLAVTALMLTGCAPDESPITNSPPPSRSADDVEHPEDRSALTGLEEKYDASPGVYAVDTSTGAEVSWRGEDRFAYASTIKALAAAALLDEVGIDGLSRSVPINASDIVPYSPVTEARVGSEMTLGEISEAAVTVSDNTAANLIFEAIGGPAALDESLERIGDDTTMVSRIEPELNEAVPHDERDTTTARALAGSLREFALGERLDATEKTQLETWMMNSRTGASLIRANLPTDWAVGDKSGSAAYGTRNDLAIIRPPGRPPIIMAVMTSRTEENAESNDELIAEAAALTVEMLER